MPTEPDPPTTQQTPDWELRFRAARASLPDWARDAPARNVYVSNVSGVFELHAWDRDTGVHRQVTDRPNGTIHGTVDPAGEWVWWFADDSGDEHGVWMRQPFLGGPDEPATPLAPSYPAGLALGRRGIAVVGRATDEGTSVHVVRPGEDPRTVYMHAEDAHVVDLSADDRLVALSHSEHGDSRHPALRVVDLAGEVVGDLWDGPGKGLDGIAFSPVEGDRRLLVGHERRGRPELLVWDLADGVVRELDIDLPGELGADWYPDGSALLVSHEHEARSALYRYDIATASLADLGTPPGVVADATVRPGGEVELVWSSSAEPRRVQDLAGDVVLALPGAACPRSVPTRDVWVDGPGGRIHALLSVPTGGSVPHATVVEVHGGPTAQDADEFAADVAAWVDEGYAVVRVNYRGSTGYGSAWRDAISERVGHTELADITAVVDHLVASGDVDPGRVLLSGASWGGYLCLLGLGAAPALWAAGIAEVPVADYVLAYDEEMEPLRAFDRSLFGGSPAEVPERYRDASPLTYVDGVRVPLLVMAGENDPRCPIGQVESYLAALDRRGHAYELERYDAGHGELVVDQRVEHMRMRLDFARRHVPA